MDHFAIARNLLREFKGGDYRFGAGALQDIGSLIAATGHRPVLVHSGFTGIAGYLDTIRTAAARAGVPLSAEIRGAAPNTPIEDVARISRALQQANPDVIVSCGGGSTIDATKAAEVLRTLGGDINDYFGTGLVTKRLHDCGLRIADCGFVATASSNPQSEIRNPKCLTPHIAVQTAAGSGAHLTKYSNVTDLKTGQKKLIVDDAIVPTHSVFDYTATYSAGPALTADGAMDGLAHIMEVFYGAIGKPYYDRLRTIAQTGLSLIVNYLPRILQEGKKAGKSEGQKSTSRQEESREALCLATDLGGYAIMLGGTNGGHLTSFSLVDILTHGRACALLNPYYTVFFAPAIEEPLRVVGRIFQDAGYLGQDLTALHGRDLGVAVAGGMFAFARAIQFPTTLAEVAGFTPGHIDRALIAAKNPQLKMKLENMPIPLSADRIDACMAPLLAAATHGDLSLIRNP